MEYQRVIIRPSMPALTLKKIQAYRNRTYRIGRPIKTKEQAIDFVNERGFIYFWPIKDVTLPSLWVAVAGSRPVMANDAPGLWRFVARSRAIAATMTA